MLHRVLCLAATVAALPVVEVTTATYETASAEIGAPWLIEVFSGMCESCKAYESVWHGLEAKVQRNTKIALGRINMDDGEGANLAMKFKGLLDGGIPAVLWVGDPAAPYKYTLVDSGAAKSGDQLYSALERKCPL
eukprot:CAMPEP_0119274514 /NCGR_PEP_ID=MMETSP1329-20130426/12272_1 /TAXON_ID=114041 /ORGANISM="Genus nov. species nov., Strain RCC1024" /LENGTH=134 /DNA_ID=CAMNT_0007274841 /DNA_START=105 /DNA_END=505 /DNA_ORIENTATION=-